MSPCRPAVSFSGSYKKMNRTRKWKFVAQEATRLAAIGLKPIEIATRLNVRRQTVQQWMAAGKIADTRRGAAAPAVRARATGTSPEAWAAAVREAYALDATDEQLVELAVETLQMSKDLAIGPRARLTAAGRFQAIVKQLRLVARAEPVPVVPPPEPTRPTVAPRRRSGGDPRAFLTAVPFAPVFDRKARVDANDE